jgi:hypothetical protein
VEAITNAGAIAAALIAILTLAGMLVNWGVVKPIKAYIDKMTHPIQPGNNGGLSLTDLHKKVNEVKEMVKTHLDNHDTPK